MGKKHEEVTVYCEYTELVDIEKIKPHPDNNNKHTHDQIVRLAKIIENNGWTAPITISKERNVITKGHARLEAAKFLKCKQVPVQYIKYKSLKHEYADLTADNEIARWAEIDIEKVKNKILEFDDFDVDLLGIKDFDINDIAGNINNIENENIIPEIKKSYVKKNDIWILGENKLLCGDSSSVDNIEKLLEGEKAELVFTDPPYNLETKGGKNQLVGKMLNKLGESIEHISDFNPDEFLNVMPLLFDKNKMNAYIFCNKDLVPNYLNWAVSNKYNYNILFWKKPNAIPMGGSHRPDVEYLLLFRRSATWNNAVKGVTYSKCLEFERDNSEDHPTIKPIPLIQNEILISSSKNGLVVDFFGGSGSTVIACEKNNRKCYCFELSEYYSDIIINRWQNYTGKNAILKSTGQTYREVKDAEG